MDVYEYVAFDDALFDDYGFLYITRMFDYPLRVEKVDKPYMFNGKLITHYVEVVPFIGY